MQTSADSDRRQPTATDDTPHHGAYTEAKSMISTVLNWLLYALSFMLAAKIVPGISVRSYGSAIVFAIVFTLLDTLLFKLLTFLTLPLVVLTLGLFMLVIRAGIFMAADRFVDGVKIDGFVAALLGSLVTGGLNWLIHKFVQIG